MKVLYITDNLDAHTGWGRYSLGVIDEMRRQNIEVAVLTRTDLPKPQNILKFFKNCLRARQVAKSFEIVHALDVWPFAIYAWFAVLGTNKKLFINLVGTYSVAPLSHILKRILIRNAFARSSRIFAISNYVANLVQEKIKTDKIDTVYLGLTPLPVPSAHDLAWAKAKINMGNPILLTVGTVESRKGQKDVAEAVLSLKQKYPNILYVMAGVNADQGYLQDILSFRRNHGLEKNILYLPDADTDSRLVALYQVCDIFLLVSRKVSEHLEGSGLVMLEVAFFGKPVIGSSDSGVPEAMQDGYNGYAIKSGDPTKIVEAIEKIMQNNYEKFANNSKEFASRFTWQRTISKYIKEY